MANTGHKSLEVKIEKVKSEKDELFTLYFLPFPFYLLTTLGNLNSPLSSGRAPLPSIFWLHT